MGVSKGQGQSASSQTSYSKAAPVTSDWSYTPQPTAEQTNSTTNGEPESVSEAEAADNCFNDDEGCVYTLFNIIYFDVEYGWLV